MVSACKPKEFPSNVGRLCRCVALILLVGQTSSALQIVPKRGTGWGYNDQGVKAELKLLPLTWWYNWGNGIPDGIAADVKVRHCFHACTKSSLPCRPARG